MTLDFTEGGSSGRGPKGRGSGRLRKLRSTGGTVSETASTRARGTILPLSEFGTAGESGTLGGEESRMGQADQIEDRNVLLVEDNDMIRRHVATTLKSLGFEVLEACDATEALAISRELDAPLELLLTDVIMPEKGGLELARELSQERPGITVIYMSGYPRQHLPVDGQIGEAALGEESIGGEISPQGPVFIKKPFTADELAEVVNAVLPPRPSRS